jgi:hypothetical protein
VRQFGRCRQEHRCAAAPLYQRDLASIAQPKDHHQPRRAVPVVAFDGVGEREPQDVAIEVQRRARVAHGQSEMVKR